MKYIFLVLISFLLLSSCSSLEQASLKKVCSDFASYNDGLASAALQENKSYSKLMKCPAESQEKLKSSYDKGYDHYNTHEANKVGHLDGPAGFGAEIKFVCVGSLFGKTYIGKGQRESIARTHLKYTCNASDNSVHCTSMFIRCRRVHVGARPL